MDKKHLKQLLFLNNELIPGNISTDKRELVIEENYGRISELEDQIQQLNTIIEKQKEFYQRKELELLQNFDSKKGNWIVKYIETKAELDNVKKFYDEGKLTWQKNLKLLYIIIKTLFQQLQDNDKNHLHILKNIELEIKRIRKKFSSSDKNNEHDLDIKRHEEFLNQEQKNSKNKIISSSNSSQKLTKPLKEKEDMKVAKFNEVPQEHNTCKIVKDSNKIEIKIEEKQTISCNESFSECSTVKISSWHDVIAKKMQKSFGFLKGENSFNSISRNEKEKCEFEENETILEKIDEKLEFYIAKLQNKLLLNADNKFFEMGFNSETLTNLKKLELLIKDNKDSIFRDSDRLRLDESLDKEIFSGQQNSSAVNDEKKNILNILNNNIKSPGNFFFETKIFKQKNEDQQKEKIQDSNQENTLPISNHVLLEKEADSHKKINDTKTQGNFFSTFDKITGSLALSEREALVYMAMQDLKKNKFQNHANFEDLLAILPEHGMASQFNCSLLDSSNRNNLKSNKIKTTLKALTFNGVGETLCDCNNISLREVEIAQVNLFKKENSQRKIFDHNKFYAQNDKYSFEQNIFKDLINVSIDQKNSIDSNHDSNLNHKGNKELDFYLKMRNEDQNKYNWKINNDEQYLPPTLDTKSEDKNEDIELMKRLNLIEIMKATHAQKSKKSKKSLKRSSCFGFCGGL